ncbi:MAG: MBL fold metallo-hydrolase [Thermomicrobiales bacterium]|nr:MBL fold metallo-hydrolase [Thermomicrobiales bacterium]
MKLTVLGGAAAGGNPGQGCSGYLVESDDAAIVLDLGPGTLPQLRLHTRLDDLAAIVVSHLHLDHVLDLLALRYALAYNPERSGRRMPLWLPPGGLAFLDRLATALQEDGAPVAAYFDVFDAHEYEPDAPLAIGPFTLRFHPTIHWVPCWAIRVSDDAGRGDLVYTADTGPGADLAPFAADAAVLVAEGTEGNGPVGEAALRGHLTPEEAAMLAIRAAARSLVLTHLWAEHDPDRCGRRASSIYPGPVTVAAPGLAVMW